MTIDIQENISLALYTTFKIGGPARFFCRVKSEAELVEAVNFAKEQKRRLMILGGGSNILVSDAGYSGLVIKNEITGRKVVSDNNDWIEINVGAGELWDDFVAFTVTEGLYGVENLSAIPGMVGAAPVQNIGAYGQDISTSIEHIRVLDTARMVFIDMPRSACNFGYRDSIFKQKKGRYVVVSVNFMLARHGQVNVEYKDLHEYFEAKTPPQDSPTLADVRQAIIDIRWNKLPDWKLWGTAGSYFKNPVIARHRYLKLREKYPDIPGHSQPDGRVKVSIAWILDHICHTRGAMDGNVGSYQNQALVVVTKPGATAAEVVEFTKKLIECVEEETTIKIEAEVEWVN